MDLALKSPMDGIDDEVSAVGVACSDALVARLLAFCDRQDVQRKHAQFCRTHVNAFHGFSASHDDEKAHVVHDLFLQYEHLFEQTVERFLDHEQMTSEAFYAHCRRLRRAVEHESKANDDEDSENTLLNLRVLLSALDFDAFCELMEREARETQRALKQAEDMGL